MKTLETKRKVSERHKRAAEILGEIGDERAVEALIALLEDGNAQWAAVEALGKIGDRRAVEPLLGLLKEGYSKETAAEALGKIKDACAIGPLVEYAKEYDGGAELEPKPLNALWALREVLEAAAQDVSTDDLREAARLEDMVRLRSTDWCGERDNPYKITVDCSHVRQLARQELIRRGVEA